AMILLALASFGGAIAMPAMGLLGSEFFPVSDNSEFNVLVETPSGSNLAYTDRKLDEVAAIARSVPGVAYTYTTVGGGVGMVGGGSGAVDSGNVYVALIPKASRAQNQETSSRTMRQRLKELGGATASVQT